MKNTFLPNWASPPGDTITDVLEDRSQTSADLAPKLGLTIEAMNDLISGKLQIDDAMASRLAETVGYSKAFWQNREQQYRASLVRLGLTA